MNNIRICLAVCAIALVLACAVQSTEAGRSSWRDNPAVKDFLRQRPMARRATEGPIGGIIDIIIDIILILLDIILGGALAPLKSQIADLQQQMSTMADRK